MKIAEWASHSVEVLLKIYAKCLDGEEAAPGPGSRRRSRAMPSPAWLTYEYGIVCRTWVRTQKLTWLTSRSCVCSPRGTYRMRDAVAEAHRDWQRFLAESIAEARSFGELAAGTDPRQLAFELDAFTRATQDALLFDERAVYIRARRPMLHRLRAAAIDPKHAADIAAMRQQITRGARL
jgi:hypothetical protein